MAKNGERGFGVIEASLLIIIVLLIGFIGWLAYSGKNPGELLWPKQNSSNSSRNSHASSSDGSGGSMVAACANGDITLSLGQPNGTAGTIYKDILFTNNSNHACTLDGYPTVVLADSSLSVLGVSATHNGASATTAVTLAAGTVAHATVGFPDPGNFDPGVCSAAAAFLLVTLPGQTSAKQLADVDRFCPGFSVQSTSAGI